MNCILCSAPAILMQSQISMYRTIVRDVYIILTAGGKGSPLPLAPCCVEHGTLGFGRVYLCALYWKGG